MWCLFFYLIPNRILMLNSIKYYIICFCSILFLLSIKKIKKINMLFFLFRKSYIFWFFLFSKKFIISHEKVKKQTI